MKNWKRWGLYLSERRWATVREDYSRECVAHIDLCARTGASQ
jgi:hypothetical protein